MPDGAQGIVTLDAYPNRAEALVGAAFKTLENCKLDVDRSAAAQDAAAKAHATSVASAATELEAAEERYEAVCGALPDEDVARVVEEFKTRRANAEEDARDIAAIRARRQK